MDEITLFTALRPPPPADAAELRQGARARLVAGFGQAPRRGRRLLALAGAAAVVAVAAIAGPAIIPSGGAGSLVTAAWAVQRNADGTVKVTIWETNDPAGLQRALRAEGVRADVVSPPMKVARDSQGAVIHYPACWYPQTGSFFVPARVGRSVVTWLPPTPSGVFAVIHPSAMPAGSVVLISDWPGWPQATNQRPGIITSVTVSRPAVLKSDRLPPCVPFTPHCPEADRGRTSPGVPGPPAGGRLFPRRAALSPPGRGRARSGRPGPRAPARSARR
jgi:hypothetical protein